jgi:hypothetical protein
VVRVLVIDRGQRGTSFSPIGSMQRVAASMSVRESAVDVHARQDRDAFGRQVRRRVPTVTGVEARTS